MFGLFYAAYSGIVLAIGSIKRAIDDADSREKTYDEIADVYSDSRGLYHDAKTGKQLFSRVENGRHIYVDASRTIRRDASQLYMDHEYERLKRNPEPGVTVVQWGTQWERNQDLNTYLHGVVGTRFKDLKTGRLYVLRHFYDEYAEDRDKYYDALFKQKCNPDLHIDIPERKWISNRTFYMDIETGMLVRVIDAEKEKEKPEDKVFITWFNNEQKKARAEGRHISKPSWYFYNENCWY